MGTLFILFWGGKDVMNGVITIGTFIAFQRFVVQLSWPMEAIGWSVTMTREGKAAERRIQELLNEPSVQDVYPEVIQKNAAMELEIQELVFEYEKNNLDRFVLNLSGLEISKGKKIGLVGPVGCGKSTLFNLLLRIYEPPPASCFLRGKDIKTIPLKDLRKRVGNVEQQVVLFGESVLTNLTLGTPHSPGPFQIEKALRLAGVFEEVNKLKDSLNTFIGEKGVTLSGGQKQRIALARALIREPEFLLLDDCFSAVDVEHEQQIIDRFFEAYPSLTILFSSHRLSVMPRMDEIWVMDKGRVISIGRHQDLIKRCKLYRSLWSESEKELERGEGGLGINPLQEVEV
jgi:ATP-binding cassette subfamily B protein